MQFKKFFQPAKYYDQGNLISKFGSWAAHHGRDLRDLELKGYCSSLVLRWGIARLHDLAEVKGKVNREQEFFEKIATINSSSYNDHAADSDIIEEMNKLELLQVLVPKKIRILDYSKRAEWFSQMKKAGDDDDTNFAVERHDVISGVLLGMHEYIAILQKMVDSNPGKLIILESHNHATGVFFDEQKKLYHFYDPNHVGDSKTQGRRVCKSINELADLAIDAFKLEDRRLKQINDNDLRIGMNIQVFSLPGMGKQNKIDKEQYVTQLFAARQTTPIKNLNLLAWDEVTTNYYLADRGDDKESLSVWTEYAKKNLNKEDLLDWMEKIYNVYPEVLVELINMYNKEVIFFADECIAEDPASQDFQTNSQILINSLYAYLTVINKIRISNPEISKDQILSFYTGINRVLDRFFKDDAYKRLTPRFLNLFESDTEGKIFFIEEILKNLGDEISPENLNKLVLDLLKKKIMQNKFEANLDITKIIDTYQAKLPNFKGLLMLLFEVAIKIENIQAIDILSEKIKINENKLHDILVDAKTEKIVGYLIEKYHDIVDLERINIEDNLKKNIGIILIGYLIKNKILIPSFDVASNMMNIGFQNKNSAIINMFIKYVDSPSQFAPKLYNFVENNIYGYSVIEVCKNFVENGLNPLEKVDGNNLFEIAAKAKNFNLLITLLESSSNENRDAGLSSAIPYIIQHELTMSEIELIKKMFSLTPESKEFFVNKDVPKVKSDDDKIHSMIEICALQLKVLLRTSGNSAEINLLLQQFDQIKAQFINRTDPFNNNYSPLHLACKNGDLAAVSLLYSHGANIYLKADRGETALGLALINGNIEIAKFLLEKVKQDKNLDNVNQAIMDSLRKNNSYNVIELLQSQKISLDDMPEKTIIRANYEAIDKLIFILQKFNHSYNFDDQIAALKEMHLISDPEAIRDNLAAIAGNIAIALENSEVSLIQRNELIQRLRLSTKDRQSKKKQDCVQELRKYSQELASTELLQSYSRIASGS